MSIIFVTSNDHKFEEAKNIGKDFGVEIKHEKVEYEEIQADILEEIVKPSSLKAYEIVKEPCFVEDAGLFIEGLNGFPGPYSSFVFKTLGNDGIINLVRDLDDRKAEFRSAIGYCEDGSKVRTFLGKVEGEIITEQRGSEGFGYDPIFRPLEGEGKTFAEMSRKTKNELSHRSRTIEKFVKWYNRNKKAEEGD